MSSTVRGFNLRDATQGWAYNPSGQVNVNFGKVLPATATGNLFVVTGSIQATLVGVVSTIGAGAAVKPSIGYTGKPTAFAAGPAAALTAPAVGTVIKMPQVLGAPLPVPLVASSAAAGGSLYQISNTTITITTDATNTAAVTWILVWAPLAVAGGPTGPTVTNS